VTNAAIYWDGRKKILSGNILEKYFLNRRRRSNNTNESQLKMDNKKKG